MNYKRFLKGLLVVILFVVMFSMASCNNPKTEDITGPDIHETLDTTDSDHQHEWSLIETVEPWFERRGFTRYSCGLCGQEYDTDFVDPLVAEGIYCIFIQGDMVVKPDTDVQSLRTGLHVFATCTKGLEVELDSYALDGALEAKTSVITVEFMDFTTTFNVTVEME